jgi:hypothetical protein
MRSAADMMTATPPKGDPIDQYLTLLSQTKARMDQDLPRIKQGVDEIMGSSSIGNMIPNGIPKNLGPNSYDPYRSGQASFKGPSSKGNGTIDLMNQLVSNTYRPGAVAKPTAVESAKVWGISSGAGKEHNFDRYYNHPKFKQLGWNPYIDNEAYYNQNSTAWDDFKRASSQWGTLAGMGFKQTFGNWDDLFSLNTAGDTKYAREMEEAMSIANSSRKGFGGFATNLYANSAYTFGVIGEIAAEEIALWGAAALQGGLNPVSDAAAAGRTAVNAGRFTKAVKGLFGGMKAAENAADITRAGLNVTDAGRTMSTASNSLNNISSARKFWGGVGNFLNPLDNTVDVLKNISTGANGFDKMGEFAKVSKTFGGFYRDLRMMNTTLAESRLEGGMVQNGVQDKLIQEYITKNGKAPIGQDAEDIAKQAKAAGVQTTLANAPAIFFSNKIVFEKALGGFKAFRNIPTGNLGKMVENFSKKAGGKYAGFIDTSNPRSWFSKKYLKHTVNQFRPQNLAKNGLRYMSANLAEGLQESYQEGVSEAMTNYYLDTYASPERAGTAFFMDSLNEGFKSQLSAKGAETFFSGFLMGGLVQGPQSLAFEAAPQAAKNMYDKYKNPEQYQRQREEKEEQRTKITTFLNDLAADPTKTFDPIYANIKAQKDFSQIMDRAEDNGDKKEHGDAVQDSIFSHVSMLINKGYADLFTNQIEDYQGMSDEELAEAFNYTSESGNKDEFNKDVRGRLDAVLDKATQIKERHEKYSSINNPFSVDADDIDERIDYIGFEEARKQAIYNEYTFDRSQSRMGGILNTIAEDPILSKVTAGRISSIFNEGQLDAELESLQGEIAIFKQGDAKQQAIGEQKQQAFDALNRLKNSMINHSLEVQKARKAAVNPETATEIRDTVETVEKLDVGATVSYKGKAGKPINGKIISKKNNKVVIQYTDAKGNTKTKEVSVNSKSLTIIGATRQTELNFEESDAASRHVDYFKKEMRGDLENYLKVLAAASAKGGKPLLATDIDRVYGMLEDYLELDVDSKAASMMVNLLNDPMYFSESAKKFSGAARAAHQIAAKKLQESLSEFENRMKVNDLIREMYEKFNVFFMPDEIDALMRGERVPSTFYDAATKKPIETNSPRYKEILDFLEDFEEENGFNLAGKVIAEEGAESFVRAYDFKSKNDKRSLRDLMKGLGLDPKLKSQMVKTSDVLDYIIANRYGKPAARALARRMLTFVKPEEEMEISTTQPIAFSYSKNDGIIVDLRYSASDFGDIQVAFEYSVLNPLIQKMTEEGLSDPAFSKAIKGLMDAAITFREANKDSLTDPNDVAVFNTMLASPEKFMAEALTNPLAQNALNAIPYEKTNENLWTELVDKIRKFLGKLLGFKKVSSNSALDEAVGIISNKFQGNPILSKGESNVITPTTTAGGQAITVDTPMNEMPKDLQTILRADLKLFNQEQIANNKPIIPDSDISRYIKREPRAARVIANYNKRNGLTGAPVTVDPSAVKEQKEVDGYTVYLYNDDTYNVIKDGEIIAEYLDTEEQAMAAIDAHKKGNKPKSKVKSKFKGKIIYTTVHNNMDVSALGEDVINTDDIFKEVLADNGIAVGDKNLGDVLFSLFKSDSKKAAEVYAETLTRMQAAADAGNTVITTSGRFAKNADMILINKNDDVIEEALGKKAVANIRSYELGAKKAKVSKNIEMFEITEQVGDVLTGKAKTYTVKERIKGKVKQSIEDATTLEELEDIRNNTTNLMAEDEGLSIEDFTKLMNKKMQELSSKIPTFEEVGKNDLLVMKDRKKYGRSGIVQVLGKNTSDNTIRIKPLNSEETMILNPTDLKNGVEYMYRQNAENIPTGVTVTPDEVENSNTNVSNAVDVNGVDAINADLEKAKAADQKEIDDEFDNSLGCE